LSGSTPIAVIGNMNGDQGIGRRYAATVPIEKMTVAR
jgi:hypothetical protein